MHYFDELVGYCIEYSLNSLGEVQAKVVGALEAGGATRHVEALQMIQLQKAILAVGMFSVFDASLQDELACIDGFKKAEELLDRHSEASLKRRFQDMQLAINVLKHGSGWSYDALVGKAESLPFRIKRPEEGFFNEGDVSEVSTLIEVDDKFLRLCAETIRDVAAAVRLRGRVDKPDAT